MTGLETQAWQNPLMLERQYRCSHLEVRVVVHHSKVMNGGEGRGQQVRHSNGSVLTSPGEISLRTQSGLPMLVIGGQILIGGAAVRPQLLVLDRPARTVESFGVQ